MKVFSIPIQFLYVSLLNFLHLLLRRVGILLDVNRTSDCDNNGVKGGTMSTGSNGMDSPTDTIGWRKGSNPTLSKQHIQNQNQLGLEAGK